MADAPGIFVLLQHTLPDGKVHWDLCLDQGPSLATWQILEDPAGLTAGHSSLPARRIADHRREYLDYQGPVSGNRGHVVRVDGGSWHLLALEPHLWRVRLAGCILIGTYEIVAADDSGQCGRIQRVE